MATPRKLPSGLGLRWQGNKIGVRVYRFGRHEWLGSFDTLEDALEARTQALREAEERPDETAGDFALRWVDEYPRNKRSTQKLYRQNARRFAEDKEPVRVGGRLVVVSNLKLDEITRPIARAYILKRRYLHPILSAMFNDALRDGLVERNPFARLGLPQSRGRKDIKVLTEAEVHALADAALEVHGAYGPQMRALILFAAYTGLRPSEIFALEWRDVDWNKHEVYVRRRSYDGDIDLPKNNRTKRVILPPEASMALANLPVTDEGVIFRSKTGRPFRKARLRDYWIPVWERFAGKLDPSRELELREARDKDHMDFYELKHFCATMLLEKGVSAEDVALQLGHTDQGQLVRERYGHPSEAAARERLHAAFKQNVVTLQKVEGKKAVNG